MKQRKKNFKVKKIISILALVGLMFIMTACDGQEKDDKVTIVCTNFPLYDWTRNLLGDADAEVILLLNNGTDMHSFQPSAKELIEIADCDVLVHVGGVSDAWLEDALEANPNEERHVVNLMKVLSDNVLEEQYVEGMQTDHMHGDASDAENGYESEVAEDNQDTEEGHKDGTHHIDEMDEHIWMSPVIAKESCDAIAKALCEVLPEKADSIEQNCVAYQTSLETLDVEFENLAENTAQNTIIVADRFPFLYLTEEYDMEYYAAFPGCSTESEADFETVIFLAEKVKESGTDTILITEGGTDVLANTILENAGVEADIVTLHSMQVVYDKDMEAGCSYIGYMEANLEVLRQALNNE